MSDQKLKWAAEQLTRITIALETVDRNGNTIRDRIYDAMEGHPKAARWDTGATANRAYCWTHECDVDECHRAGKNCLADDIVGGSDSTGDTAAELASRADQASTDLNSLSTIGARIAKDTHLLLDLCERWPQPRPASAYERSLSLNNQPQCESCSRVKRDDGQPLWGEPIVSGSTGKAVKLSPGGLLEAPQYMCQTCRSHLLTKGVLPPVAELERVAKGNRRNCTCEDRKETWSAETSGSAA